MCCITTLIHLIDDKVNHTINQLLHHPSVQKLEANWRSLALLVQRKNNNKNILIKFLDISKKELAKDLLNAIEFEQTHIFKLTYSYEYDHAGGVPYNLLIGCFDFNHQRCDINMLSVLAKIGAACYSPFIANAAPALFGLNDFAEYQPYLRFAKIFAQHEYDAYRQLRKATDSKFIGLTLPHFLLRAPYPTHYSTLPLFQEKITQRQHYLWGQACIAFACVAINTFIETGWFAHIKGLHPQFMSGGTFNSPVRLNFATDNDSLSKMLTETLIIDNQEKELAELGFISLKDHVLQKTAVFYNAPSIQISTCYDKQIANTNSRLTTLLHYTLCLSRFAHYIKVIMRNWIGRFTDAQDCENFLRHWLSQYTAATTTLSENDKVRYPLNAASIRLTADHIHPGKFNCILRLKPHYQLDAIETTLTLTTKMN